MKITLKSIGSAKMPPNYVKSTINIFIKDKNKEQCGQALINVIGNLDTKLKEVLQKVYFDNYSIQEVTKVVDKRTISDGFAGIGTFSVEFALDFKTIETVTNICKQLSAYFTSKNTSVSLNPSFAYTLTEEDFAKLNSQAVNNALDKMKMQANDIAEHLLLPHVTLIEVNFVENPMNGRGFDYAMKRSSVVNSIEYESYTIASLDDILKLKDVEVSTEIYSQWALN